MQKKVNLQICHTVEDVKNTIYVDDNFRYNINQNKFSKGLLNLIRTIKFLKLKLAWKTEVQVKPEETNTSAISWRPIIMKKKNKAINQKNVLKFCLGLVQEVLLLMDNAPAHRLSSKDKILFDFITTKFFPSNITFFIQPMVFNM